ncbi:MAG TPA: Uma2 family endonuclease, partial [Hyphomicrobiaceae bacterium]|nr:Uma2 family endonuclease [Hyphomicrobiaceae bacterium]
AYDPRKVILTSPVVVVEVSSPSSERDDAEDKVSDYFSVPSIIHYLIVNPVEKVVVHHTRGQGADIERYRAATGDIKLTPPGMTVPVAELLRELT